VNRETVSTDDSADRKEVRDLLEDPAEVLGNDKVPAADVPARLRDLAPGDEPYRSMSSVQLRQHLADEHGIRVPSTLNRYPVDPAAVRARLAERANSGTNPDTDPAGADT